ncbi:MAG TPA: fasciclin domain-containing protein [Candidatus Nanopelagicales bacterium]|nr:fasciclin domain-containing protein [Candidatus Nanopelagicales bacterium]
MRLPRRIAAVMAGAALATGAALAAAPSANALSDSETSSFLGQLTKTYNDPTVSNDGNPYDFDIVTKAVLVTGADKTLASLPSFTLFAPNDRAFEVLANKLGLLGPSYRYGATVDEKRVITALVTALGVDKIRQVLLYHVLVGARVTGAQVLSGPFYQRLTMANGQTLSVTVLSRSTTYPWIVLGDKDGRWLNDYVVKSKIDVVKTPNAVVHGISDVLLPSLG